MNYANVLKRKMIFWGVKPAGIADVSEIQGIRTNPTDLLIKPDCGFCTKECPFCR